MFNEQRNAFRDTYSVIWSETANENITLFVYKKSPQGT